MTGPRHPALRSQLALGLAMAANLGLLLCFRAASPSLAVGSPVLLVALAAIAFISYFGTVAIRSRTFLDAEFVAALLALVFLGPVAAVLVWLVGEIAYFVLDRHRLQAHLANVASYASAALAGSLVLNWLAPDGVTAAVDPVAYVGIALTGVVMLVANFAVTRGIVAIVLDGRSVVATLRDELIRPARATALMILVGTATAVLYTQIDILALGLFTLAVFVPHSLLLALPKLAPVAELDRCSARALYAQAIARMMGLGNDEQLVLKDAASYMRRFPMPPEPNRLSDASDRHRLEVIEAVLYSREHWDGRGGTPGAVGGEMIPLTSRILAVADAWAGLTAKGLPSLTHRQALDQLEARAAMHFDPRVVAAAQKVVESERFGVPAEGAYQPRLHRVPFPGLASRLQALTPVSVETSA